MQPAASGVGVWANDGSILETPMAAMRNAAKWNVAW